MKYDIFKIWPSSILGCFLFSLAGEGDYKLFWYFFVFIWTIVGVVSFSLNDKKHFKETLITNILVWLLMIIVILLIALPYYISLPLLAILLYLYFKWTKY